MSGLFTNAAFIGALLGLIAGLLQYAFLARAVFPHIERAQAQRHAAQGGAGEDYSFSVVKNAIFVSDIIILPAIGYFIGPLIASMLGYGGG